MTDVVALVKRITYKPGWTIRATVEPRYNFMTHVTVSFSAPDSNGSGVEATVHASKIVGTDIDEERALHEIFDLIHQTELHEVDEWLKLDGKHVVAPHP